MRDVTAKTPQVGEWVSAVDRLERLLVEQVATQRRLLEALDRKREAIARADAAALERLAREEQQLLARHAELDGQREQLVAALGRMSANEPSVISRQPSTGVGLREDDRPAGHRSHHPMQHTALGTQHSNALSLLEIAQREGGERGERLIALRDQARANVAELKRRSGILAQAAVALSAHLTGIMQAVGAAAMGTAHARTYSRHGRLAGIGPGAGVVSLSAVDLTT